ncbi:MAG: 16S rRNA (guanine(966)-N(2))-methyltransferase RsmD [Eubacterium sp.]|nr:16S rRNA (guanine(966)-N(2))-methyltransferase RsmD [Eubacterium sp.]SEF40953.1 16S rRNA (guanine966-N2)-methyltransferase [Eubacterium ruminantium]
MRVIAGSRRSLPLKTVEGLDTRPTTDRIKETLFNILMPDLADSVFWDLFSGSGGIGIEALSRGASRAVFVENNANAVKCINDNIKFTKFTDEAEVFRTDVLSYVRSVKKVDANIIFMDPPYRNGFEKEVLTELSNKEFLDPDCIIIVEADKEEDFSYAYELGFDIYKNKEYKSNKHVFMQKRIEE